MVILMNLKIIIIILHDAAIQIEISIKHINLNVENFMLIVKEQLIHILIIIIKTIMEKEQFLLLILIKN